MFFRAACQTLIVCVAAAGLTWVAPALADVRADSKGKCPSDYTPYTRKNGDAMCKSPDKKK